MMVSDLETPVAEKLKTDKQLCCEFAARGVSPNDVILLKHMTFHFCKQQDAGTALHS
jgi:hypothetical protein